MAAARILQLLQHQQKPFLRLAVETKGCNLAYLTILHPTPRKMYVIKAHILSGSVFHIPLSNIWVEEKGKFDELVEEKGVRILVDPKAVMHVIGTEMHFVDDKLRSEFVFINPNAIGKCGCGESFTTTRRQNYTRNKTCGPCGFGRLTLPQSMKFAL
ncbi:unnamed protein product [Arabidopsis halleri]